MNMVGRDGQTQYYRLTPAEAIAALQSHTMGLTNTEAARRFKRDGAPIISPVLPSRRRGQSLEQALVLVAALAATSALLAEYIHQTVIAGLFGLIALGHAYAAFRLSRQLQLPLNQLNTYISTSSRVMRNGNVTVRSNVDSGLVVGDIVRLEAGDKVPADLRLLTVNDLVLDESELTGSHSHVRSYTHPLAAAVPVFARHNLAYLGSTVVSGDGFGVVIATGRATELGQSAGRAANLSPGAPLERHLLRAAWALCAAAVGGSAVLIWLGWANNTSETDITSALLTLLAALAPGELLMIVAAFVGRKQRKLRSMGAEVKGLYALNRLQSLDMLLFDPAAFGGGAVSAERLRIGHTLYTIGGDGYAPAGAFRSANGKRLTKKELSDLSILFQAGTLAHHTAVLEPDARDAAWHVHGNHTEGALLAMARKAGVQTEKLRDAHELLNSFPYDHHRHMASAIRQYGDDQVLFVYGQLDAVTARSQKLWDHGHVRTLSGSDRAQFARHQTVALAEGMHTVAVAYRILPKRTVATRSTADKAEQQLTLLGMVDIAPAAHAHTKAMLQLARTAGTKVSLLSAEPQPFGITSEQLQAMTDSQALARLHKGTTTFTGLAPEDTVRLITLAQRAGYRIGVTGAGQIDLAAMTAADVSIATPRAPGLVRSAASVVMDNPETIFEVETVARRVIQSTETIVRAAIRSTAGLAVLAVLNGVGSLVFHLPLALNAPRVLTLSLLVYPWFIAATAMITRAHSMNAQEKKYHDKTALIFGSFAGCLAFIGFLVFFMTQELSPQYISSSSHVAAEAGAIALITLILCQLVDALVFSGRLTRAAFGLCTAGIITGGLFAHLPAIQPALGLHRFGLIDWALSLSATTIYWALHLFERYTRKHARHTVIKLHNETFNTAASAKF